jgi:hypothetical protein
MNHTKTIAPTENEEGVTKRITLSIRMPISITVDAQLVGGEVTVIRTVNVNGLPSAPEVMEALDAEGEFGQLDEAYENATGDAA